MAKVTGGEKFRKALKNLQSLTPEHVGLVKAAERIETEAKRLIGRNHAGVPSLPGEPPHGQTGALAAGIVSGPTQTGARVVSSDPASASLEFGTSRMVERPFLRPAVKNSLKAIATDVAQEVRIKLRRA